MCGQCQRYGTLFFLTGTLGMRVKNGAVWIGDALPSRCIMRMSRGISHGTFSSCGHLALRSPYCSTTIL